MKTRDAAYHRWQKHISVSWIDSVTDEEVKDRTGQ